MLVEFSVAPMGKGDSISADVAKLIDIIDKSGLPYRTHAMGTLVEGSWEDCMKLIRKCHDTARKSSSRVYTRIAIDDRKGKSKMMERKLESVERKLGRPFQK